VIKIGYDFGSEYEELINYFDEIQVSRIIFGKVLITKMEYLDGKGAL
jgi:hypothetical protein